MSLPLSQTDRISFFIQGDEWKSLIPTSPRIFIMHEKNGKVSVVCVVELSSQKMLIMRRAPEKNSTSGHDWTFITETFEDSKDHSLRECASRGLKEEVNIFSHPSNLCKLGEEDQEDVELGFFVLPICDREDLNIKYQIEEVADHKWVDFGRFLAFSIESPFTDTNFEFINKVEDFLMKYPLYMK